jgi:hypothetical protein
MATNNSLKSLNYSRVNKSEIIDELKKTKNELESLKENIIREVMAHESCDGCQAGKVEFIQELGLEAPKTTRIYMVEIDITDMDYIRFPRDLENVIADALYDGLVLRGTVDDYSVNMVP